MTRNQSFGSAEAEFVRDNGVLNSRLNAHGGVDALGGTAYFSRGLDEGFAVVKTEDIQGVPVSLENQVVAHTDQSGRAVISNLRPYQNNRIGIDPLALPMEASVSEIEKIVVPRSHGGVLVDFDIHKVRSATLTMVRADGTLLPPWTPVDVVGMDRAFVSGNRGEVFLELPHLKANRVIAHPANGPACEMIVDLPDADAIVPYLGSLTCAEGR